MFPVMSSSACQIPVIFMNVPFSEANDNLHVLFLHDVKTVLFLTKVYQI
jgi:hypothetical protein